MAQAVWENKFSIMEAVKKFGTPFYCYEANILKKTFQSLRAALPKQIDIFYSFKANPNIAIAHELKVAGAGAELCSYYETIAAIKAGFDPKNIIFVGPAKSDKEIHQCLLLGIYAIVCESISEFKRVAQIASTLGKIARVALRINPTHVAQSAPLKMGGKPSQFGMDEEVIFKNQTLFLNSPHIKLVGIHIYNGTRILKAKTIIENTIYILNLAHTLQEKWNHIFEMVDIGGGLGVPYFEGEESLDLSVLKSGITPIVQDYLNNFPDTRLILESGRYLAATAGVFVSRVQDIKFSKGEWFAITDGGTHCHMAATGLGSFVKRNFPITACCIKENKAPAFSRYNVTGPLCTPGDLLGKQVLLPTLSVGDVVLVHHSGAYGPTASPVMFLSHGFPAEIVFKNNEFYLIRDRFSESEFINKQYLIN